MEIGIVGLGLIGGSLAKAISQNTDHTVYGTDISEQVVRKAVLVDAIEQPLTDELLPQCDIVIVALYPQATIDYVKEHASLFKKDSIVVDCGGIKQLVCDELIPLAEEHGFLFVGGHPMAGREVSGFKASTPDLYKGASMLLVPTEATTPEALHTVKHLFSEIGFSQLVVTTAEHHDRMIAYTSQLCHIISSAYIKSPSELEHKGYSGGSYRDLTRVAYLNETMWTELFIENKQALVPEIDEVIKHLQEYRDVIAAGDEETLFRLLQDGKKRKEQFG